MPEETLVEQAGTLVDDSLLEPTGTVFAPEEIEPPQQVEPVSAVTSDIARTETTKNLAFVEAEKQQQADLELKKAEEAPLAIAALEKKEAEVQPLTLINPETGQETTFNDPDINVENIQSFINRGFEVSEGALPSRVHLETQTSEEAQIQSDIEDTDKQLNDANAELDALRLATSELNKELIQGIKDRFEQRRFMLEDINKRSLASFQQFGFRSGAIRRSASFTGILSSEERAGIQRLTELDVQEKNLLIQAQAAANEQDFVLLSEKIRGIEETRRAQVEEASRLNEASIKQQEEILARERQVATETSILNLFDQGITNIGDIQKSLVASGIPITVKEIADTLKSLGEEEGLDLTGQAKEFQSFIDAGLIDSTLPKNQQWNQFIDLTTEDKLLSVEEAKKLGVAFGTTESQAFGRFVIDTQKDTQPSSSQFQAGTFAKRMEQAEGELSGGRGIFIPFAPKFLRTEDRRLFEQAERNFINALLRRESGAAIAPDEFDSARQQYIPLTSDSQAVLNAKAENRKIVFEGLKAESANAFDVIGAQVGGFNAFDNLKKDDLSEVDEIISTFNPGEFFE